MPIRPPNPVSRVGTIDPRFISGELAEPSAISGTTQTPLLVLTGTIVCIIPVFLVIFMIVELQTLNDVIAEAEADISMGLQVAWSRDRAAAHVKPGNRTKLAREINFIGRSASHP
jgi:hypothetical protein